MAAADSVKIVNDNEFSHSLDAVEWRIHSFPGKPADASLTLIFNLDRNVTFETFKFHLHSLRYRRSSLFRFLLIQKKIFFAAFLKYFF
jgi:hypothetical protein